MTVRFLSAYRLAITVSFSGWRLVSSRLWWVSVVRSSPPRIASVQTTTGFCACIAVARTARDNISSHKVLPSWRIHALSAILWYNQVCFFHCQVCGGTCLIGAQGRQMSAVHKCIFRRMRLEVFLQHASSANVTEDCPSRDNLGTKCGPLSYQASCLPRVNVKTS
jgi:hypothetical protein